MATRHFEQPVHCPEKIYSILIGVSTTATVSYLNITESGSPTRLVNMCSMVIGFVLLTLACGKAVDKWVLGVKFVFFFHFYHGTQRLMMCSDS